MSALSCNVEPRVRLSDDTHAIDYDQLRALQADASWAQDRDLFDLQRAVAASDLVVIAWDGPALIGCVRVLSDFVYRAVLCDVIVHPEYRRQGIGRLLVEHVTAHPRLARVQKFTLLTATARSFYERLGWKRYAGEGMVFERGSSK